MRHSLDYADNYNYPPKYAVATNNYGYVTHTDYARYCLPPTQRFATNRQLGQAASNNSIYNVGGGGGGMNYPVSPLPSAASLSNGSGHDIGLPAGTRSSLIV